MPNYNNEFFVNAKEICKTDFHYFSLTVAWGIILILISIRTFGEYTFLNH